MRRRGLINKLERPPRRRHLRYVLAYRSDSMIAWERQLGDPALGGFKHSHNDKVQWDTFRKENVEAAKGQGEL